MRLFLNDGSFNKSDNTVAVTGGDVNHIKNVLRLKKNAALTAVDKSGLNYTLKIVSFKPGAVVCEITDVFKNADEPETAVTLFQSFPKTGKMDFIVEKCVELGIFEITPVFTQFSQIKQDEKTPVKLERLNRVAHAAAKQSGRAIVPKVNAPLGFYEACCQMKRFDAVFCPWEKETRRKIEDVLKGVTRPKTAAFMIGPEGGFSPDEADFFTRCGIPTVTLGKRILRAETAGIVSLTIFFNLTGEF